MQFLLLFQIDYIPCCLTLILDDDAILFSSKVAFSSVRDLECLCVGRFEKFQNLEDIWNLIKKELPKSQLVLVGRVFSKDWARLRNNGIDHRRIVSEQEKLQLYSRTKVFIFPSIFEGFGMEISEALAAGLLVVAWKLPVFEERFGKEPNQNVKLVELGKPTIFANHVVTAIREWDKSPQTTTEYQYNLKISKTWDEVGKNVVSVLTILI